MVLGWVGRQREERSVGELIARKQYSRALDLLRAQLERRQRDVRLRLQLADVLVLAGRQDEAAPVFLRVADELIADGFVARALAVLKRLERLGLAPAGVAERVARLGQGQAAPRTRTFTVARDAALGVEEVPDAPAAALPGNPEPTVPGGPEGELDALATMEAALGDRPEPDMPEAEFEARVLDLVADVLVQAPPPPPAPGPPRRRPNPLFEDLAEDELVAVTKELRLVTREPGEIVFSEGERGRSLFVLSGGTVKVFVRDATGRNLRLREMGEGTFFGEIALLSGQPRSATVTAATCCELLELDRGALDAIAAGHPRVLEVLDSFCAQRLANPAEAAVRSGSLADDAVRQRAASVLEARFGDRSWDPRMRLKLGDALVRSGMVQDGVAVLLDLARELAERGLPEKSVAILKKVERLRGSVEIPLAPAIEQARQAAAAPASPPPSVGRERSHDSLGGWLREVARSQAGSPDVGRHRHNPLFADFAEDELATLVRGLRLIELDAGDVVVTEGEPGDSLYILSEGSVRVFVRDPRGRDRPLRSLGEGDFFGEAALLQGRARTATVVAASRLELLELDRSTLDRILKVYPRVREVLERFHGQRADSPEDAAVRRGGGDAGA